MKARWTLPAVVRRLWGSWTWRGRRGDARGAAAQAPDAPRLIKTFIAEGSPVILDNLALTLEEMAPVRVIGAAGCEATALQQLARLGPEVDLVLIDAVLKEGSGLGVLRGLTQGGLRARRVILTTYATPEMRRKCEGLGAHRVFDRSTDVEHLIQYCTRLAGADGALAPG